jgi:hypothetical protein
MGFKSALVFVIFFGISADIFGQESQSKMSLGVSYGFGNELSNTNYLYTNQYLKGQLFYTLTKTERFELQIVLAPEINFATHQLFNFYFVTPDEPNFQERRDRFMQLKDIREYVLHVGFLIRKPLSKQFSIYVIGGISPMVTDTETERLSKGFAFSDVLGLGVSFHTKQVTFDFRPNFRHNSNAGLQNSNAGINTLNFEFGVVFPL